MKEKINNFELQRLIAFKCNKLDFKDVTDDEIKQITELSLRGRLVNGKKSGIEVNDVILFSNLISLTISDMEINQECILNLLKLKDLKKIEIIGCIFDNVDFSILQEKDINICFIGCEELPFKYPYQKEINVKGCKLDFNNIDFSTIEYLSVTESTIINAHNLDQYDNIKAVNIDASVLMDSKGKQVSDIKVSGNTQYSHFEKILQFDKRI